jgi:predicted LPLAT superfamily acyltransferase
VAVAQIAFAQSVCAMSSDSSHWANVGEVGFVFGMKILFFIERYFGRWPFRLVLAPVVLFYVLRQGLARRASKEYFVRLQAHTAALKRAPVFFDTLRHVFSFSETLLDKALAASGEFPFEQLRFKGREVMVDALERKQGGVLITAHMGCLEVCRIAAEKKKGLTPVLNVLVHTKHAVRFNELLRQLDPTTTVKLIQVSEFSPATAVMLSECVERGEFVVIAGDRVPIGNAKNTVDVPFLGAPASFPLGPWILASTLKCQVILFCVLHQHTGGYLVSFEKLADRIELPRKDRIAAAQRYVAEYANKLSQHCTQSPYDWFNFYPFWEKRSGSQIN